jgi:hypothetical protein
MLLSRSACVQHCSSAPKQPQILRHVCVPTIRSQVTSQQLRLRVSNQTETVSQQADLMLQAATSHFAAILDVLKRHDLEGLIPYMAELNVVKAVVRCVSFVESVVPAILCSCHLHAAPETLCWFYLPVVQLLSTPGGRARTLPLPCSISFAVQPLPHRWCTIDTSRMLSRHTIYERKPQRL